MSKQIRQGEPSHAAYFRTAAVIDIDRGRDSIKQEAPAPRHSRQAP